MERTFERQDIPNDETFARERRGEERKRERERRTGWMVVGVPHRSRMLDMPRRLYFSYCGRTRGLAVGANTAVPTVIVRHHQQQYEKCANVSVTRCNPAEVATEILCWC